MKTLVRFLRRSRCGCDMYNGDVFSCLEGGVREGEKRNEVYEYNGFHVSTYTMMTMTQVNHDHTSE